MYKFGYRSPRYPADFPVRVVTCDSVLIARCINVSADGMTVLVDDALIQHSHGQVSFEYDEMTFDLHVCVAHFGSVLDGLRFLYKTEDQRNAVHELICRLSIRQFNPGIEPISNGNAIVISRLRPFS